MRFQSASFCTLSARAMRRWRAPSGRRLSHGPRADRRPEHCAEMITPNTIVGGRYRVIKALGGGGMKLVYLAEDLRLAARRCALAEMVDSFTSPDLQQQAVTAFQREADMLAQLANEHIPRIFDRFSEANRHYLGM